MTSEADLDGMVVEAKSFCPLDFVAMWQMAGGVHSDTIASDMEVQVNQRCETEFLQAEKIGTYWPSSMIAEYVNT